MDPRCPHVVLTLVQLLAQPIADIETGEIGHRDDTHRHAEAVQHAVDLFRRCTFEHQHVGFVRIPGKHAVADEALADAGDGADLANLLAELQHRRKNVGTGLLGADNLEKAHDVGRREEMHAQHPFGMLHDRRDLVDIEVGGIGCEYRVRTRLGTERREHVFLDVHVFEDGFDDQVGIGEVVVVRRAGNEVHTRFDVRFTHPALSGTCFVVLANDAESLLEGIVTHFQDGHGNAGVCEVHRNTAAHRAGPDDADPGDASERGVTGEPGNLRGLTFRKEDVL